LRIPDFVSPGLFYREPRRWGWAKGCSFSQRKKRRVSSQS